MTPEYIESCIAEASANQSKCSSEILALEGMSSAKVRHLLNNICSGVGTCYLEVGIWKGATFCAANYGNSIEAVAVDNFSQFGGTREQFLKNFQATIGGVPDLHDIDFRGFPTREDRRFNVFFYDGNHSHEDQRAAITRFTPSLESEFALIVDDWNSQEVQSGTLEGIAESRVEVVRSWELPANFNGDRDNWWNGLFVALCRKTDGDSP